MSQAQLFSASYNNRSLFSDYYLEELVVEDSHWRTLKGEASDYRQRISDILKKALPGIDGSTPEAEVERRLIRPILDALGHVYFVQPAVPTSEGVRRPDYAFFPSPGARQAAESHKGEAEFFKTALAVGDAKAWQRSLDKRIKGPGDPFTNHNPSYQIDFYLRATEKKWGLLTNGQCWRLYHRDLSYRLDVYYEVELPQAVCLEDDAFLYFLAFFHKEAFQPEGTGECFLDRAYRASAEYATRVSEELKDNVYEALRLLAEGFLCFPGNDLKAGDLDLVRENAFIVIYRLLFILYAEAREFLPVSNAIYSGTYSLRAITHEVATKEPFETNLHPIATGYWSRLQELFRLLNNGDDFLQIPPYNGRLFDDQKEHQTLAAWKIGDRCLAAAIDQLSRARAAGRTGRGFVSYRDLGIRELGSIYEGLLEHSPRQATEDMAAVRDDKREKLVPLTELGSRRALKTYRAGSVYLETEKGERKATGSYYTPDYIVKYIVGGALGPLLEEAKEANGNLIDAILSFKVLDPAMGSGHFLVEATDYLARALVEALGGDPREMEEDEIRWARREVVERCIYGVDLNPLAVDLAKLSLWLSTVSLDKPLNFLNHHLRCGNSLIGARLEDLGQLPVWGKKRAVKAAPASQGLLEYYFQQNVATAVDNYFRIATISSDKLQDIRYKEGLYGIARDVLRRYLQVAHVWTSAYFGNEVPADGYMDLQDKIRATDADWTDLERQPWFAKGVELAVQCRFFHWELEFPEVYFDRNGQRLRDPGFSAIVANPPYLSVTNIPDEQRRFFLARFSTATGRFDLYILFLEQAIREISARGRVSFINPIKFAIYANGRILRLLILGTLHLERFVDISRCRIFDDPTTYPCIILLKRRDAEVPVPLITSTAQIAQSQLLPWFERAARVDEGMYACVKQEWYGATPDNVFPPQLSQDVIAVSKRLSEISFKLGDRYAVEQCIRIGSEAQRTSLIVSENQLTALAPARRNLARRVLDGADLDRYQIAWPGLYLIYDTTQLYNPKSPSILDQPKVLLKRVAARLSAAMEDETENEYYYPLNTIYTLVSKGDGTSVVWPFLVALLNSSLADWYYKTFFGMIAVRGGYVEFREYLQYLPIRAIKFCTPSAQCLSLNSEARKLYARGLASGGFASLLGFVEARLPKTPDGGFDMEREQSDVVHDLLVYLAEEMTRLHREKQAEIKGFLLWLESYLGVPTEDVKNRTRVKEYWKAEVEWDGFFGAVEQNRRAIQSAKGIDVTRREPQETIRAEFTASMAKLNPLLKRIELTDKLIDQVVYKLYGLTEEEIAVVEGNCRVRNKRKSIKCE